jgi:hypothetical protein
MGRCVGVEERERKEKEECSARRRDMVYGFVKCWVVGNEL